MASARRPLGGARLAVVDTRALLGGWAEQCPGPRLELLPNRRQLELEGGDRVDRKSTRLNSSHDQISYAVFCLKKKDQIDARQTRTTDPHSGLCVAHARR